MAQHREELDKVVEALLEGDPQPARVRIGLEVWCQYTEEELQKRSAEEKESREVTTKATGILRTTRLSCKESTPRRWRQNRA